MSVVVRLHLLRGDLHLRGIRVGGEVHHAHVARLPGELDEAVQRRARHDRGVGNGSAELLLAVVLAQALVEPHGGYTLRLGDLLVAVAVEAAVDLEERLGIDPLGELLVAHANAGPFRADAQHLLGHEPIEHRSAHLRIVHDRGIELAAQLAPVVLGLVAQRLVELLLADAHAAHGSERVAAHGRAEIEIDAEEAEGNDEEQGEQEPDDPLVRKLAELFKHGGTRYEKGEPLGFALRGSRLRRSPSNWRKGIWEFYHGPSPASATPPS